MHQVAGVVQPVGLRGLLQARDRRWRNGIPRFVSGIDSLVPIIGDFKSDFIVGMSHHINVPLGNKDFDDTSGLLITRAGPLGVPGALETLATAVADATGATVRYDDSAAPKNYDVRNAQDGAPIPPPRRRPIRSSCHSRISRCRRSITRLVWRGPVQHAARPPHQISWLRTARHRGRHRADACRRRFGSGSPPL